MPKRTNNFNVVPADYLDSPMARQSIITQHVWFRMLLIMCESNTFGYLTHGAFRMGDDMASRRCGVTIHIYRQALVEMERIKWLTRDKDTGAIYSQMLIDQGLERAQRRQRRMTSYINSRNEVCNGDEALHVTQQPLQPLGAYISPEDLAKQFAAEHYPAPGDDGDGLPMLGERD